MLIQGIAMKEDKQNSGAFYYLSDTHFTVHHSMICYVF